MISVVIGTYGNNGWRDLAWSRAYPSVDGAEAIVLHGDTLADARNNGARLATGSWLCFLDADDELTAGFVPAMMKAIRALGASDRLFTPRVQYVGVGGRKQKPLYHPWCPPEDGNWLVIGTVVPKQLFFRVGGFEEWPKYEEWALFARMQKTGAKVVRVPDAIYRAHRNPRGRHHEGGTNAKRAAHELIRRAVFPELYEQTGAC